MSDTNNRNQFSQEMLDALQNLLSQHSETIQTLQETAMEQMSEITALCLVASLTLAALPADKNKLVIDSLSDMLNGNSNLELAGKLREILERRLHLKLSR
ncbi:hypothetical protein ACT2FY_13065 [Paraburkholderia fungorum]|uniref:hypothetical protein n=1 Tax=Paraburkholderia fungorum TaxID=134537 RepID=UPI00402BCF40